MYDLYVLYYYDGYIMYTSIHNKISRCDSTYILYIILKCYNDSGRRLRLTS